MSDTAAGHQAGTPALPVRRFRVVLLVWAAVLAAADLAIKAVAETLLAGGDTIDLWLLNLDLHYNPGVAFSMGANLPSWVIITATGLIITALVWYLLRSAPTLTGLSRAGGAMLLGGALGNFIDRLDGEGVVDYLHSGWFPTFNLADVFVTIGVALFILGTLRRSPAAERG